MSAPEGSAPKTLGRAGSWGVASIVFLAFFGAYLSVWEPAHDEGVTFTQVMGPIGIENCRNGGMGVAEATALLEPRNGYGPGDVVHALTADGMHPPAYYLGLHAVGRAFGSERIWLAGIVALLGLVSIYSIGRIASRMAPGRHAPTAAMLLLASSPWFLGYSIFLRPYAPVLCFGLLTTWAVLEIYAPSVDAKRRQLACVAFVVFSALGLYTLYHYALVWIWQMLALLILAWNSERRRQNLSVWAGMGVAILLLFAPWVPSVMIHLSASASPSYYFAGWPALADWLPDLGHLVLVFVLGEGIWSTHADVLRFAAILLLGLTIPCAVMSLRRRSFVALDLASRALWATVPVIVILVLASDWFRDTHTIFLSKVNFIFLPIGILLIVRAFQELLSDHWSAFAIAAWILLFAVATSTAIYTRSWAFAPMEVVSEAIKRADSPGHLVLVSSDARGYVVPLLLSLRSEGVRDAMIAHAPREIVSSCVEAAIQNPSLERVTLIHFDVPYRPAERLSPAMLGDLAQGAQEAGWSAVRLQPSHPQVFFAGGLDRWWTRQSEQSGRGARQLVIATPTKSKYFSE